MNEHYKAINTDKNGKVIDVSKSINKLYDHVNIELARMAYSEIGDYQLSEQGMTLDDLSKRVGDLQKDADDIHSSLDKAQTDYIAILGIFASVVLAFVGGMAFSTSVLENIRDVSIYRLLTVSLIIGMVFVTVIFLMFYFVGILTRQKQFTLKTCVPLIIVYTIFGILLCSVFVMWKCGTVELRNSKITRQYEYIETTESETTEITEQTESETN